MCDRLSEAVEALKAGKAVIFPTDTVYGLGVSVEYAHTLQEIYDVKQRDAGKPIAWLVGGLDALDIYGEDVPETARQLAASHWPGALTIIVKASEAVPEAFRSPAGTVGLRMPASETARELIEAVGPIAASSANVSGGADAADSSQLDPALTERVAAVIRGEQPGGGIASTVIDCSKGGIDIIRQGSLAIGMPQE